MAKSELFGIPLLGLLFRHICVFPVKRDVVDRAAIRKAYKVLEEGHMLALFPEGRRSKTGEMAAFKPGAALFAHRAKAPVIPILFENTPEAFPKRIWRKIRITVGNPMDLAGFLDKKANSALLEEMSELFKLNIASLVGRNTEG